MDQLERGRGREHLLEAAAERFGDREREDRAKPLPAAEHGVTHRLVESGGRTRRLGQELVERPVDLGAADREAVFQAHRHTAYWTARVSRTTLTRIGPGYSRSRSIARAISFERR